MIAKVQADTAQTGQKVVKIPVDHIHPSPYQKRRHHDQQSLQELADSILTKGGLIQPVVVRCVEKGSFELIAGERRWRAHKLVNLLVIDAIIKEVDDETAREMVLIENLQREDLTLIEEAQGLVDLAEALGNRQAVADRIKKSLTYVTDRIDILTLPREILNLFDEKRINQAQAKVILEIEGDRQRIEAAQLAARLNLTANQLRGRIQRMLKPKKQAGEGKGDATVKYSQVSSGIVRLYDSLEKFDLNMLRDPKKRETLTKQIGLLKKTLVKAEEQLSKPVEVEAAQPEVPTEKAGKKSRK